MKKNDNLRKIPKRNYTIVTIIFTITIVIAVFLFVLNKENKEYQGTIPVIRGVIAEIQADQLEDYFQENDDFLLYIGVSHDENSRELEEDLKDVLKKRGLLDTVYLNLTDLNNKSDFYKKFNDEHATVDKLSSYPAFIIIKDRKVLNLVQRDKGKLKIEEVEQLLDEYEVTGEIKW